MNIHTLLMTKAGSFAFFALIAAGIVIFLRMLYGPKGKFRDKQWDYLNDVALLEHNKMPAWLADHYEVFLQYTNNFLQVNPHETYHLQLKITHTQKVLHNAMLIATQEPAFATHTLCKALLLAALYHDIGRFEQFARYKTFADATSCNHGQLSKKVLSKNNFLQKESKEVRHLVYAAVCLHNRFTIPPALPETFALVVQGVRDADKLDVLRVLEEHLGAGKSPDNTVTMHLQNISGAYSPAIYQALQNDTCASYTDMRYVNDFRILLCTWLPELHFAATRNLLYKQQYLQSIIAGMDGIDAIQTEAATYVTNYFTTLQDV